MVFYAAFNTISVILRRQLALFMLFLGFTSTRLGLAEGNSQEKKPEDPVWLKPRIPALRLKHFTTDELHRTPCSYVTFFGWHLKPTSHVTVLYIGCTLKTQAQLVISININHGLQKVSLCKATVGDKK